MSIRSHLKYLVKLIDIQDCYLPLYSFGNPVEQHVIGWCIFPILGLGFLNWRGWKLRVPFSSLKGYTWELFPRWGNLSVLKVIVPFLGLIGQIIWGRFGGPFF